MSGLTGSGSIKARLIISGAKILPEDISLALGISPTETWRLGEKVTARAINLHKENGWMLGLDGKGDDLFAEELIDRLLSEVPTDRLVALCKERCEEIEVELSIVAYLYRSKSIPSIALSKRQVQLLAACNGTVDIDLYLK